MIQKTFSFIVTKRFTTVIYEWAKYARVLHYTRMESLARDKHSSLLGPLLSYEGNEVLWIRSQKLYWYCTLIHSFYEWAKYAGVLHYTRMESLARDKHSSLSGPLLSYEGNEVLWVLHDAHQPLISNRMRGTLVQRNMSKSIGRCCKTFYGRN